MTKKHLGNLDEQVTSDNHRQETGKPYATPKLQPLGKLTTITLGGSIGVEDSHFPGAEVSNGAPGTPGAPGTESDWKGKG